MEKRKKWLIGIGASIAAAIVVWFATTAILNNIAKYEGKMESSEKRAQAMQTMANEEKSEFEKQTGYIGGQSESLNLPIAVGSEEYSVIDVMHKMTHQKVKAEEKWGAIEMTIENINEVFSIVLVSDFERKNELLRILEKWQNGNFDTIISDHNYFWTIQGGSIGKAYGIMSPEEEKIFIENNFR